MQPLPAHVLRELQHQGQGEDEEETGGPGEAQDGGRRMDPQPQHAESETSFPLAAQNRPHTPSPPTPPRLLHEGSRVPRRTALQISRGRRRGSELSGGPQSSIARPGTGSTTPSPPQLTPTRETESSQLLGRRATADADSLTGSVRRYQAEQIASASAQIRSLLLPESRPGTPLSFAPSRSSTFGLHEKAGLPSIPLSELSDRSSENVSTPSSAQSDASSFACELRRLRPDTRLLKKRSKPLQHVRSKPFVADELGASRGSLSKSKPKLVQNSDALVPNIKNVVASSDTNQVDLKLPSASVELKPLRKVQTFAPLSRIKPILRSSDLHGASEQKIHFWPRSISSNKDPGPDSSGLSSIMLYPPSRQIRPNCPEIVESPSLDSPKQAPTPPPKDRPRGLSLSQQPRLRFDRQPPATIISLDERHIASAATSSLTPTALHMDSYFHSFPPETTHGKEFVPAQTPSPGAGINPESTKPSLLKSRPPLPAPRDSFHAISISRTPSNPITNTLAQRKISYMSNFFKRTASSNQVPDDVTLQPTPFITTPSTQSPTPGIKVSDPDGTSRRHSSIPDMTTPSYFTRPRYRRERSESTMSPSPGISPMAIVEDSRTSESPGHRQSRRHRTSSSEQLSPRTRPGTRMRPRHQPTLDDLHDEAGNRNTTPPSTPGTSLTARTFETSLPGTRSSPNGEVALPKHISFAVGPADASSGRHRQSTVKKHSDVVKHFFLELRRLSSVEGLSSTHRSSERRESILHRISLPRLRLKSTISTFGLRRTPSTMSKVEGSREIDDNVKPVSDLASDAQDAIPSTIEISPPDLKVTNFHQTPFSQRYYDSKKATQQQIRAHLDADMDEDNDDDDEIVLGFERNVPDHFPNSPLCPLHPKHKSGGKAICPMHRRYRKSIVSKPIRVGPARSRRVVSLSSLVPQPQPPEEYRALESSQSGNRKMTIVFDTREGMKCDVRTNSMGSDGAGIISSPSSSGSGPQCGELRRSAETNIEDAAKGSQGRKLSESDTRGRRRSRGECGSDRRTRRTRMRRRQYGAI